jgi:hypothetical protein
VAASATAILSDIVFSTSRPPLPAGASSKN